MSIKYKWRPLLLGGFSIIFTNCNSVGHSTGTMYNIEQGELKSYINKANTGDLMAVKKLENFYTFIEEDNSKSIIYLKLGLKLYNKDSLRNYLFSLKEQKRENEINKCISWLEDIANKNNSFAERELYELYKEGKYVDKNLDKSNYFFKKLQDNLKKDDF